MMRDAEATADLLLSNERRLCWFAASGFKGSQSFDYRCHLQLQPSDVSAEILIV